MATVAKYVLSRIDNGADPGALIAEIPQWQWAFPGGHWRELSKYCPHRRQPDVERRRCNGLNIEIGQAQARCMMRPPDDRGVTKEGSNLAWLLSGGSLLDYGPCAFYACWKAGRWKSANG